MTALREFRAGEPIHDSYGAKSNGRFLVNYGFTLDGNDEDDEAAVRLEIPPGAPLAAEKARLLGALPGEPQGFRVPARADRDATFEALSFLRVACASPRETERLLGAPIDPRRVRPLNGRNESAALRPARRRLRAGPPWLPDHPGAGRRAPPRGRPLLNARNAVVARRSEKRVLLFWLDVARAAVPLLRLPGASLARALAEGAAGDGEARRYLDGFVAARRSARAPSRLTEAAGSVELPAHGQRLPP